MKSAKVMLLGDIGVGKSSLARRFVFDSFEAEYKTTIGVDVLTYDVDLGAPCEDAQLRFVLWDTDGDFGSRIFETVYLAGASAAIIVADATRPATPRENDRPRRAFRRGPSRAGRSRRS